MIRRSTAAICAAAVVVGSLIGYTLIDRGSSTTIPPKVLTSSTSTP